MVVSWARAILSISKKAWTFPARPYYYILSFPKITGKPNNRKKGKGTDRPPGRPRGEALSAGSFPVPAAWRGQTGPPGQPHVRKSCLGGSCLVPWPCHGLGASWRLPTGDAQLQGPAQTQLPSDRATDHAAPLPRAQGVLKGPLRSCRVHPWPWGPEQPVGAGPQYHRVSSGPSTDHVLKGMTECKKEYRL